MRRVLINSPAGQQQKHCAYAGYSDFYRFPEIDGVMVEVDDRITLFLNPFSPRKICFAASPLAKAVRSSVFDVEQAGSDDTLFIADGDAPRRNDEDLLKHLEAKYPGFQFVRFLQHCAGTVMTTIDGSQGVSNKSLQPERERDVRGSPALSTNSHASRYKSPPQNTHSNHPLDLAGYPQLSPASPPKP
jgi:hypothetical protein